MGTREKRIGIRELKSTLSECVREVKAGRTIVVTDHGRPVARIIPEPAGKSRGTKTVADLVTENRE